MSEPGAHRGEYRKVRDRYALTVTENRVAKLITAGYRNREIADLLGKTERTVKMHIGNVLRKLGIKSRKHVAVALAGPQWSGAAASGVFYIDIPVEPVDHGCGPDCGCRQ